MEDREFEELAKALASGQSRRRIVRIAAGSILAGAVGLFGGGRVQAGTTTTKAPTTTTKAPTTTTKAPTTTTKAPTTTTKAPTTTTKAPQGCFHSTGPNGGCKGACAAAGCKGHQCNKICGNGQFKGACPVGQGGGNPCSGPEYCRPKSSVFNVCRA